MLGAALVGGGAATVDLLGWAITGAALFAGGAWALGSRTLVRDVIVGLVLAVLFAVFLVIALLFAEKF